MSGAAALESLVEHGRIATREAFAPVENDEWVSEWIKRWQRLIESNPPEQSGDRLGELGELGEALRKEIGDSMQRFAALGKTDRSRLVARVLRAGAQHAALTPLPKNVQPKVASRFAVPQSEAPAKRGKVAAKQVAAVPPESIEADAASSSTAVASTETGDPNDVRTWPLTRLSGVGTKLGQRLAERGLATIGDLVFFLPSSYIDRRRQPLPEELSDGDQALLSGNVRQFKQNWFGGRYNGVATIELERPAQGEESATAEPALLSARWFHRVGGLEQRLLPGQRVTLAGTVKNYRGQLSMVHPEVITSEGDVEPIGVHYPAQPGFSNQFLRKLCRAALELLKVQGFDDPIPAQLAPELPNLVAALERLHLPTDELSPSAVAQLSARLSPEHRRMAFDEFFYVQLAYLRARQSYIGSRCSLAPLQVDPAFDESLRAALPFEPTQAQWKAIEDISRDFASGQPMLRLVQGDVGSGKTVVAFAAAVMSASAGGQAAIMAPTELLAVQHLRTLQPWCEKSGLRIALLTGSLRRAERATLLALLAARQIDVLVGTHALLVQDVVFAKLGLVVVDEQHRFGVEQRARLREKGEAPHLLVMTATPIPRTLALAAYGEMEISVMQGLPPGRTPPVTRVYAGASSLEKARARLIAAVAKGIQAFVVCPLVAASEVLDVSDVEATAAALRAAMPEVEVALVHGRMVAADKDAAMEAFRSGKARVLVATTVIEVGVDVPNARLILVEHAERFGLAQLHQLRGRIGRGEGASLCMLHTASGPSSIAGQRLRVLESNQDGFAVAEADLEIRGPGEVFGTRQSGLPRLRFASFGRDGLETLTQARKAAATLLSGDPQLREHAAVKVELERRLALGMVFSNDAG
jgi:ATP-dependent DNA helicase RecG